MELLKIRKEIITDLKEDFPELVDKFNHFVISSLHSKQNSVISLTFNKETERLPKEMIVKIFRTKNADNEYNTLKRLKKQKLLIPDIIFYKKPYLFLEKAEGVNLCDYINDKLVDVADLNELAADVKKEIIISVEKLADWFTQLHTNNMIGKNELSEIIVLNKGDTRLRDFVYNPSNNELYGMDFEESYEGNHIDDIAWVCCSLLDTNPGIFEMDNPKSKIDLLNLFLKTYYRKNPTFHFNFKYFTEKLIENLNIVMRRRHINLKLDKENFIKNISKEM